MTDIVERIQQIAQDDRYDASGIALEAADTIEALQAQVTELEKLAGDSTTLCAVLADIRQQSGVGVKPMLSELAQAVGDRIRALEEALRPFADEAEHHYESDDDDPFEDWDGNRIGFTVSDLRRARDILKGAG